MENGTLFSPLQETLIQDNSNFSNSSRCPSFSTARLSASSIFEDDHSILTQDSTSNKRQFTPPQTLTRATGRLEDATALKRMLLAVKRIGSQNSIIQSGYKHMQATKNQFSRKQRKLFSRDRSGLNRNNSRLKSKESQDRLLSDHNSPKPKYLILGIRNQLTSLREEVAKLSRRDKAPHHQVLIEYQSHTPRDKKNNSHHFEDSRSHPHRNDSTQPHQTRSPPQEPLHFRSEDRGPTVEKNSVAAQLRDSQRLNVELQIVNQSLQKEISLMGLQLKREDGGRLENKREKSSLDQEIDRTVMIQKHRQQQEQVILELRKKIDQVTNSNAILQDEVEQLRRDIQRRRKEAESELEAKDQQIQRIRTSLQQAEDARKELTQRNRVASCQIQELQERLAIFLEDREKEVASQLELKRKGHELQQRNLELERKVDQYQRLEGLRTEERAKLKIRELQGLIKVQEKSMENYQSDLHYLQKQLRKTSLLKPYSQGLCLLIEDLNGECMSLRCQLLQKKLSG